MGSEPSKQSGPRVKKLPAERPGESEIYRSALSDDIVSKYDQDISTLYEGFTASATKNATRDCLGWREGDGPYQFITYKEVQTRTLSIGSALVGLGLKTHVDKVGVFSINRAEWIISEHACNAYSFCLVPLYDTLGPDVCSYIINQAEIKVVFVSPDKIKTLLSAAETMKCLTTVVQFGTITDEIKALAQSKNVQLISFADFETAGKDKPFPVDPPKPEELSTICYTSGTTGLPKGVMISHQNFLADMAGVFLAGVRPLADDVHISYLPLAHVFERGVSNSVLYFGGAIGFFSGDVRKLFDDIQVLKPTIFPSVPRLWNRLYDKVMGKVQEAGGIGQSLFENAYAAKLEGLKQGYITHAVWDSLVFKKIREQLGGRVRLMVTGSAPVSDKVMDFLRICFSCPVLEGYGQTETSAAVSMTMPSDTLSGNVGVPLACAEIKLVSVPEMNYIATEDPPRGEICFRGPCCTKGYFKAEDKTAELIDEHGWLHSGDIGTFLPEGNLKIIDRKKNIFKLSQGEYVAPEKLENIFVQSKYVAQAFVYGDSLKSSLVAVVVPDPETLVVLGKELGVGVDMAVLCEDAGVRKAVMDDMVAVGKANALKGFELPAKLSLSVEAFSVENDILTPTFKIKRPQAKAFFQAQIDKMYEGMD